MTRQEQPPYTRFERAVLAVDVVIVAALNAALNVLDGCASKWRRMRDRRGAS